jgi:hypothetical protein
MIKSTTGARISVDRAVGSVEERVVHLRGGEDAGQQVAGVQEALIQTAERMLGAWIVVIS